IPPMAINGVAKSPPPSSGDPIMTSKPKRVVVKRSPSIGVPAWMTPEDALHFLRFAWGCYGWPAYMMSHLCTGLCNLWSDIRCADMPRGASCTVKHFPLSKAELPNGGGIFHRGVLRSAQRVLSMLDKPLADALARHPDYDLVTTGHSLGAAVAAVLAYFLRPRFPDGKWEIKGDYAVDRPLFKTPCKPRSSAPMSTAPMCAGVRCFAFSPPSGTVDETRGLAMRDFVMTVVVGDDMVPRLGHNQLEALNREMVSVLLQCDMAKDDLNSQGLRSLLCGIRMTPKLSSDPAKFEVMGAPTGKLAPSLEVKNPKPGVRPATIDEILDRALPTTKWPLMLTPGRILHIARTEH
uniref:sn-1-specific diacylglycerol lipase n=2 Tax=Ixodes scapularis TaxID=6945 RepID=A0A1S4KV32_IXOSC